MFRARRSRISLVFAVIFVLLILHFTRSHDPPVVLQVPPPPPGVDHQPPFSDPSVNNQVKNPDEDSDRRTPAIPPAPERPQQQPPPWQQPPQQQPPPQQPPPQQPPPQQGQQPPYRGSASEHDSTVSIERPGPPGNVPPEDHEISGQAPQSGAQTQGSHGDEVAEETLSVPHWKPMPEKYPIKSETLIKLPTGPSKSLPTLQAKFKDESSAEKMQRLQRLEAVKSAFLHAWNGYKVSAMGHDEVKPLGGGFKDPFNGWGATLVDSLDTLWIMDLKQEFSMAVDYVKKIDFTTSKKRDIPVFETVIRYLGGLLGAYDISGHKYDVLLEKAVELAEVLMGAFDTPNRMPTLYYKWSPEYASQLRRGDVRAVLAELGSLSLEFTRLAQLTRDDKYYDAIARITNELEKYQDQTNLPGLWPLYLDASGCRKLSPSEWDVSVGEPVKATTSIRGIDTNSTSGLFHDKRQLHVDAEPAYYADDDSSETVSSGAASTETFGTPPKEDCTEGLNNQLSGADRFGLGALGDSTYEYLPKEYMLLGGNNEQYPAMYKKSMDAVREHLVFQPMLKNNPDVRFLATVSMSKHLNADPPGSMTYTYEGTHLTCFAGGMVAMGSRLFGLEEDMELGRQLTDGCVWAYEATKTGIMPEAFRMLPCEKGKPCEWSEAAYYRALDPRADDRPKSHSKRSAEKASWHVNARPEPSATTTAEDIENREVESVEPTAPTYTESAPTHEEYVAAKIRNERLPPGMVGISGRQYILRPEAIESVFIMFRLTGDPSWREKGWKMFQAVSKATKTELANSAIADVTLENPQKTDSMESFWLAETLKYFYLLFSDPRLVSLDEYVLNTEAHPFKRPVY